MVDVVLREITRENFRECISLRVGRGQTEFVASNVQSLAEAKINPALVPLAIYDRAALGAPLSDHRMVGFTMYELIAGTGFILRLMIGEAYQRRGYGRAAMREVIRRLRLHPDVQLIGTSHRRGNEAAARLYRGLGFRDWRIPWPSSDPDEIYLVLSEE